jgi:hypothetical protein
MLMDISIRIDIRIKKKIILKTKKKSLSLTLKRFFNKSFLKTT